MTEEGRETLAPRPRILIVDDEPAHVKALCDVLPEHGYEPTGVTSADAALRLLQDSKWDLLLTDLMMPHTDGIALLRSARALDPELIGIIMTGQGTVETAVQSMKSGALDYVLKPLRLSLTLPVLERALSVQALRRANKQLERHILDRTKQLELANQELELANQALDTANRALEAANAELEGFSYSVSHDLRVPLRAIRGFSHALEEEFAAALPDEARALLARVEVGASKMDQLIDDMLRFARLSRQPLAKDRVDVGELVLEVSDELRAQQDRVLDLKIGALPPAKADPALLRQVFINLLSNALKFTRQRKAPRIEVGFEPLAGGGAYFVLDNGVGFDMRYASKLFGVFQRLHTEQEFEGTGVGLSIVRRIVERHGGRIWAQSELDRGSIFRFTLAESGEAPQR